MTKRRLSVLLATAIAFAAAVGAVAYKRLRTVPPDAAGAKTEDAPPAKAPAPARQLTERERLLVGTWKFDNVNPNFYTRWHEYAYGFTSDCMYTFSFSSIYVKHWSQHGKFRVTGDITITEPNTGEVAVNLMNS